MNALMEQPLFLISICILLGNLLGNVGFGYYKLGSSATLFVSLAMSYAITAIGHEPVAVPQIVFSASLIGFIVSVGLNASKQLKAMLRQYGFKFPVLAIAITVTGAMATFLLGSWYYQLKYEVIGGYVGALTSSPGLATVLELAKRVAENPSGKIGAGYAVAYIPGVLIAILFSQWYGRQFQQRMPAKGESERIQGTQGFKVLDYFIVVAVGILIGSFKWHLSETIVLSVGTTGGALLSALFLGANFERFTFNETILNAIQEMALNVFLAIVGINYGYQAIEGLAESGIALLGIGMLICLASLLVGYGVGKYLLKISDDILAGAICGGMTSTPGLGAAIEAFRSPNVAIGYGATYPFALISMIINANILFYLSEAMASFKF
ncbi:YidE/YbjL duplication [Fusibacter paucivorans]|uniref:YidE/YbjL duplication n=1 Tax=Fusibacter paucivorans TaxID=76009 RepID=A0ABS5PJW3_9FIRM|nr:YidE/YbjL duplication [Fusibacter paucivorans]MBS7525097.1 YidE/YbjL duplication [Fusibacter paucivorans]